MKKLLNINNALSEINQYFAPRIIGEVNDVYVKLAKINGNDVPWHKHDTEDELFYIIHGSLVLQQENCDDIIMNENDLFIVKRNTSHRVYSNEECHIMLVENKTNKHTGDIKSKITMTVKEQKY